MTAAIVITVAIAIVAVAARFVVEASKRRHAARQALEAWTDGAGRTAPDSLDVEALGLSVPPEGALLGVLFTHPRCDSCRPLVRRLDDVDGVQAAVVDVTAATRFVRAAGVSSVPTLVLVDRRGEVVRSWVGTPLAGTVEETVRQALGR